MGRTGGPGGKFLGLRGLSWRNKIQIQSHSRINETNMVVNLTELVGFVVELQLRGWFSSVISILSTTAPLCLCMAACRLTVFSGTF